MHLSRNTFLVSLGNLQTSRQLIFQEKVGLSCFKWKFNFFNALYIEKYVALFKPCDFV